MLMLCATLVAFLEAPALGADGVILSSAPSVERMRSDIEVQAAEIAALKKKIKSLQWTVSQMNGTAPPPAAQVASLDEFKRRLEYLESHQESTSMEDLTVLGERVTSFEARLLGIEGKVGELETRVSANEMIDAEQAVEIAQLKERVESLDRMDAVMTESIVDLEVKQRASGLGEIARTPINLVILGGSVQEVGSGKYYEYVPQDVIWMRYPNTTTLVGGGAGVHFAAPKMFAFGLEGRAMAATAGGYAVDVVALPMLFVDPRGRVEMHLLAGWQHRGFPRAVNAPSFAAERQVAGYGQHGFALGFGLGATLVGYGKDSGETPGELVLRPEIKVALGGDSAYYSAGANFLWRLGFSR